MPHFRPTSLALISLVLAACASTSPTENPPQKRMDSAASEAYSIHDRTSKRVVVQLCLPDKTANFDEVVVDESIIPEDADAQDLRQLFKSAHQRELKVSQTESTLHRLRAWVPPQNNHEYPKHWVNVSLNSNTNGVFSHSSPSADIIGATESGQPVFMSETNDSPKAVLALSVAYQPEEMTRTHEFWFSLPRDIPSDHFTEWRPPFSEEVDSNETNTWWRLAHGKQAEKYPIISKKHPTMRFRLMSMDDSLSMDKKHRRAITAAQLRHVIDSPDDQSYPFFLPPKEEDIPPCH